MTERVVTSFHTPCNLIPMNWGSTGSAFNPGGGQTNPFSVTGSVNPNTSGANGGPITPNQATALAGMDGNFTVGLTGGFTPPVTLTAWHWCKTAASWIKVGPAATIYAQAMDATYTQWTFLTSEGATILIQSSAAITGSAYTDGTIVSPSIGAAMEGYG